MEEKNIFYNLINFKPWKIKNIYELIFNDYNLKLEKQKFSMKMILSIANSIYKLNEKYNLDYCDLINKFQNKWKSGIQNKSSKIFQYFNTLTNSLNNNYNLKKEENLKYFDILEESKNLTEDNIEKLKTNFNIVNSYKNELNLNIKNIQNIFNDLNENIYNINKNKTKLKKYIEENNIVKIDILERKIINLKQVKSILITEFKSNELILINNILENNKNILLLDRNNKIDSNSIKEITYNKIKNLSIILNGGDNLINLNKKFDEENLYEKNKNKINRNLMSNTYFLILNSLNLKDDNLILQLKIYNKFMDSEYYKKFLKFNYEVKNINYLKEFYFIVNLLLENNGFNISKNKIFRFRDNIKNDYNLLEIIYLMLSKYCKNDYIIFEEKNKKIIWKEIFKKIFSPNFYNKENFKILYIIELSWRFNYKKNNKEYSILEKINKMLIFKEKKTWVKIFESYIKFFKKENNKNVDFFDKIKNFEFSNNFNKKYKIMLKTLDNIYVILDKMKLNYIFIKNIITFLCDKYKITSEDKFKILNKSDFIINNQIMKLKKNEFLKLNKDFKINNLNKSLNLNDKIEWIILWSIKFLGNKDIIKFIYFKKKFVINIYKHILVDYNFKDLKRILIYKKIIINDNIHEKFIYDVEYFINFEFKGIIEADVLRTYKNDKEFNHKGLILILLNIINNNKNIKYFQGMNYFIGFFYKFFEFDIITTYKFCSCFLNKYFNNFIINELESLKSIYFTLSNIFKIEIPDLYQHFIQNKIEIEMFSTQWILTLFTIISQFNNNSLILLDIIDIFISKSWFGFIKVFIIILKYLKSNLLILNFDKIINILNNIYNEDFITDNKINLKLEWYKLKFSEEDCYLLRKEFLEKNKKKNEFWQQIKN